MATNGKERDVGKIIVGIIVFLVFSAFPLLVVFAHLAKSKEESRKLEPAADDEEKFWCPPKQNAPPPGKRILTPEQKIKEANSFYFMDSPKELGIQLPPPYDSKAPAPTTPEYDLDGDFIFLAVQVLRKQSMLGLTLSQFREKGSAKNSTLLKELTSAADTCSAFAATIETLTNKILKMEEIAADATYKRAYVLSRMTAHPVARNLVAAFKPAVSLQSPDPASMMARYHRDRKIEAYDKICDKCAQEIPLEAHHVLIYHSGFVGLKPDVRGGEDGATREEVYDPENRILVYNPDATALIIWETAKEDFEAGNEDTAEARVAELIELLTLLPESPLIDEWLPLIINYSGKMDTNLIHYLTILAFNYTHINLYDAAKEVLDARIESGKAIKGLYPTEHPLIKPENVNETPTKDPVNNIFYFTKSFLLIVDRANHKTTKQDFFGPNATIENVQPHLCREFRYIFDQFTQFQKRALDGKKIFNKGNHNGMIACLYERALRASFAKKDGKGELYYPTAQTDPRMMILMAVLQRQIVVFGFPLFVPLDPAFMYQPLNLTLFEPLYRTTNQRGAMDVPMRLYDGTMLGEPEQGSVPHELLVDPRGVALTEKALKMCIEQRLTYGISRYRLILEKNMVDPKLSTESWYGQTFKPKPDAQAVILKDMKLSIFKGNDPVPEVPKKKGVNRGS